MTFSRDFFRQPQNVKERLRSLALPALLLLANIAFLAAVYVLLDFGRAAQRTHNYSILKQFETDGILITNIAQQFKIPPARYLFTMYPLEMFHSFVFIICCLWSLILLSICWHQFNKLAVTRKRRSVGVWSQKGFTGNPAASLPPEEK